MLGIEPQDKQTKNQHTASRESESKQDREMGRDKNETRRVSHSKNKE